MTDHKYSRTPPTRHRTANTAPPREVRPLLLVAVLAILFILPASAANAAHGPAARPDPSRQVHIAAIVTLTSAATPPTQDDEATSTGSFIDSVEWIPHPSGRRLAVYPTDYGRYDAPASDWAAAWDEVLRLEPDVDHAHMRDQFRCHFEFARIVEPDKPSWNLELWRSDVGYTTTVGARCNP